MLSTENEWNKEDEQPVKQAERDNCGSNNFCDISQKNGFSKNIKQRSSNKRNIYVAELYGLRVYSDVIAMSCVSKTRPVQ